MDPPTGRSNNNINVSSESSESSSLADVEVEVSSSRFGGPSGGGGARIWTQSMIDLKTSAVHEDSDEEARAPTSVRMSATDAHFRPVMVEEPEGGQPLRSSSNEGIPTVELSPPTSPHRSGPRPQVSVSAAVKEPSGSNLRVSPKQSQKGAATSNNIPMPRCGRRTSKGSNATQLRIDHQQQGERRSTTTQQQRRRSQQQNKRDKFGQDDVGAFAQHTPAPFADLGSRPGGSGEPEYITPTGGGGPNPSQVDFLVEASLVQSQSNLQSSSQDQAEQGGEPSPASATVVSITDPEALYNKCFLRSIFLFGCFVVVIVVAVAVVVTQLGGSDEDPQASTGPNEELADLLGDLINTPAPATQIASSNSSSTSETGAPTTPNLSGATSPTTTTTTTENPSMSPTTSAPTTAPSANPTAKPTTPPPTPPRNYNIHLYNYCVVDVEVAIYYQDAVTGDWETQCWYSLSPGKGFYAYANAGIMETREMNLNNNRIKTNNPTWYMYAKAADIGREWKAGEDDDSAPPVTATCGGESLPFRKMNSTNDYSGHLYSNFTCASQCSLCRFGGFVGNQEKELVLEQGSQGSYWEPSCGNMQQLIAFSYSPATCEQYENEDGALHWQAQFLRSACECPGETPPSCPLCGGGKLESNDRGLFENNDGVNTVTTCWDKYIEYMSKPSSECNETDVTYYENLCGCEDDKKK